MSHIKKSLKAHTSETDVVREIRTKDELNAQSCTAFSATTLFCPSTAS